MLAEGIRTYVNENYFEPARESGDEEITIRAGTVRQEMELKDRQPAVCSAMRSEEIQGKFDVELIDTELGKNVNQKDAANIWYTYKLQ